MTSPLRVLVTNDDGAASAGVWHLAAALSGPGREVVVAIPHQDSSGFAAAVGDVAPGATIRTRSVEWPAGWKVDGVSAWMVEGPPGRCVLAAVLGVFGDRPDIVVSGVNAGANTGRFLQLHSGTLGAALTAANSGLRAMAVSLDTYVGGVQVADPEWAVSARVAAGLVDQLLAQPGRTVWNVNVPNLPWSDLRGIQAARIGRSRTTFTVEPMGDGEFALGMALLPVDAAPASSDGLRADRELLDDGFVSITSVTPPGLVAVGEIDLITT